MSFLYLLALCFVLCTYDLSLGFVSPKIGEIQDVLVGSFQYEHGVEPVLKMSSFTTDLEFKKPVTLALVAKEQQEPMPDWKESAAASTSRFLKIVLEDVWQEYEVTHNYNFVIPKINAQCKFYCESCNNVLYAELMSSGNCGIEQKQCFTKSFTGYTCGNCKGGACRIMSKPGSVCCVFSITPDKEINYYAFYFEIPKTYYKFSRTILDADNRTLMKMLVHLESGTTLSNVPGIDGSTMKIESYSNLLQLFPMWGFVNRNDLKTIKTTLFMNHAQDGIYRPNLNQLGWYQLDNSNNAIPLQSRFLQSAFDISVHNFGTNDYTWHFNAIGCKNGSCSKPDGDILEEKYASEIVKAELFQYRTVIIRPRQQPTLKVTVDLSLKYHEVLSEKDFDFDTFTATLNDNEHGASVLNIIIYNGYGQLIITIESRNFTETRTIVVQSLVRKTYETKILLFKYIPSDAWVCLTVSTNIGRRDCCRVSKQIPISFSDTSDVISYSPNLTNVIQNSTNDHNVFHITTFVLGSIAGFAAIISIPLLARRYLLNRTKEKNRACGVNSQQMHIYSELITHQTNSRSRTKPQLI